jgi:hypothetical protein
MNETRRLVTAVVTATGALGVLLALRPLPVERLLAAYVLVLASIAIFHFVRAFRSESAPAGSSQFEQALREHARKGSARPGVFLAMEREIELGVAHAGQAHRRLLPLLRAAAAARLQTRHGIALGRGTGTDAARRMLGEDAWELLRPDRPPPDDPFGPGPSRDAVTSLIERVETL